MNLLINLAIAFLILCVHAWIENRLHDVPKLLLQGTLIGLPAGIFFDLTAGHQLGLYSYIAGFTAHNLVVMGALAYGIMIATILLIANYNHIKILLWILTVGFIYETTNYLFPVWEWSIGYTDPQLYGLMFCLYVIGTYGILMIVQRLSLTHFSLLK